MEHPLQTKTCTLFVGEIIWFSYTTLLECSHAVFCKEKTPRNVQFSSGLFLGSFSEDTVIVREKNVEKDSTESTQRMLLFWCGAKLVSPLWFIGHQREPLAGF